MIMKIQKREIEMINDNDKMRIWTGNGIGESGARMISLSLKTNTTLTTLYLGCDEKWSKMKWKTNAFRCNYNNAFNMNRERN